MGTITVGQIVGRAQKTLYDETGVQWGEDELIDYVAAGINAIVATKPDVFVKSESFALTAGETKHEIPAEGIQLVDVIRNVGGKAIRQIDRNHLDHSNPDWHQDTDTQVLHFMHDRRDPRRFYVYPAITADGDIEIVYAAHPTRVTAVGDLLPIDDLYENPLHNYAVAYAYAKNSKRGDLNKANAYFTLFANAIGAKQQVQMAFTPLTPDEAQATEAGNPPDTR